MADSSPSPPPTLPHKLNLAPFYYGLVVVGTTAVVLAMYNLIVMAFCARTRRLRLAQASGAQSISQSFELPTVEMYSTFKYSTKGIQQSRVLDNECSVCLSVFEDGESIRQLPRCKHSFHAQCIDMWLFSHSDCPLCRAFVGPPVSHNLVFSEDNSRENLHQPSYSV
ncbi:RING-type E3 ubiquitin transferase [Ranunculus cassubicifolius]